MPVIYLSPSTQEGNFYVTGGSEEYYMNRIADAMIPYLRANGIGYVRNTPDMTAYTSIQESNNGNYDLHLALHSNGAPEGKYGQVRGSEVYYYPSSAKGRRAAQIIAENLRQIYPGTVRTLPTTFLGEVRRTRAPGVLIEFAYHDNQKDANWIQSNIDQIAQNVVQSLTQYFGLPFLYPQAPEQAVVRTSNGAPLNLRAKPSQSAPVVGYLPDGAVVTVWGQYGNWFVVEYNGNWGFASVTYVDLLPLTYGEVDTNDGTSLNLRLEPNASSTVLASIPDGTVLALRGREGQWYLVTYQGVTGYVNHRYIRRLR